ncbi:ATP-binding cassette domain-containing protein [Erysipelothrix piscisicarius]
MLQLNKITKTFNQSTPMETTLYHNLNLSVEKEEFITIIGSNGSGKSTLLNLICGQINPDKGTLTFGNRDLLKMKKIISALRPFLGFTKIRWLERHLRSQF